MRAMCILAMAAFALGACGAEPPNDGDAYFDNITPDPAALEREAARLEAAETDAPPAGGAATTVTTAAPPGSGGEGGGGISDSQDFGAVTARETIQSDAARLDALRATYAQVPPEALPERGDSINLAAYALSQKHAVGTKVYRRVNIGFSGCRRFRDDPDAAQRAFLGAGGPQRDRRRLDPDGDGFACGWTPDPYRRLLRAADAE